MNEPISGWPDAGSIAHSSHIACPDALRDAAMGLAVHDQRIDAAADIVDGGVALDVERAGFGIDLDLAQAGAVWIDRRVHFIVAPHAQAALQCRRQAVLVRE